MLRHSGFLVGCCGAVFAIAAFFIGLEVSSTATTAAPSVEQSATTVNRTLKGDRMPLIPSTSRNAVNGPFEIKAPPAAMPELLDGCEPVISSIGQTPLAKVAGRCVS
jgi:hypothetical protein